MRAVVATFALSLLLCHSLPAADDFESAIAPVLRQYCHDCHGADVQEAGIRYDQLDGFRPEDRRLWTAVHEKLSAGEMPPPDETQPEADEKKRILQWIEASQQGTRGDGTRRLNRRELAAALRDLTGLSVDYARALPGDGKVDGFDTAADGLQDSADSVGQWMTVTRRAVDGIRFLEDASSEPLSVDLRDEKDPRKAFDPWKEAGVTIKGQGRGRPGMGMLLEPKWVGERGGMTIYVPPPADRSGVLRLKLVVAHWKPISGVPNPRLWVEVGGQDIDYREITASAEQSQELVYEVQFDDLAVGKRGVSIELSNRVELPYGVKGFENEDRSKPDEPIPGGAGLFRPAYDRKKTPQEEQPVPFVVVKSIEVNPDYVASWPPATWQSEGTKLEDNDETARRLLNIWLERGWRRPVSNSEQERFLTLYQQLRGQQMSFDESLRAAFQSVLLSGGFRYLKSPADADPVIAQHAIASRLSFMLWGAPPDEELRQLAAAGKLHDPKTLDAQVDRLLDDPRSEDFVRPFVTQWLEIGQPITITMDYFEKQDFRFARYLKESMRDETIAYVAELFDENRPARELVSSDWTMMNDILAMHYGYENIEHGELRKVPLRKDDPRGGGILGQAGIQSMLCWMGDNWVIYRGAWTLRHILDDPPPPPPLEVPELIPSDNENRGKTFRELLVQHQEHAKCSVCHKTMDPLGFAFQNFDISGRWRDLEYEKYVRKELDGKIEWRGAGKSRPVDAVGRLPRGEEFQDFGEFKQLLVENYSDDLVEGLMKRFVLYGTGRTPDVSDMAQIRKIMQSEAADGYRLRDLLKAMIRSPLFLDS